MQQNARGIYVNFTHDRAADWDFLAKWQPNVIRYMGQGNATDANSFDVNRVKRIHDTCPEATILLRCWEVDDNNFSAHNAMVANPQRTAELQVNWWSHVFDRANMIGVPRDQLMAGLNNETGPEKDSALYPYSEWALKYGTQKRVRLGVCVFSVGRPPLPGEAEYTIDDFAQLDDAILENNGAVLLHEYLQPEGMYAVWTDDQGNERKDYTYLIGRHTRWNIKSPIIIGEWGIDGILYNRHPDPQYGNSGWRNFPKEWWPERYADEYVECVRKSSDNVIGICPFISDFADRKWASFDMLEAYGALLARKDLCVKDIQQPPTQPQTPPQSTHIPTISTGVPAPVQPEYPPFDPVRDENWFSKPKHGTVTADNVNVRNGPGLDYEVVDSMQKGEPVLADVEVDRTGYNWVRVANEGWIADKFVQWQGAPTPAPSEPVGDKWQRTINFILKEEGGYTPNDEGAPANFGINQGANPDLDVKNITREQAIERYRTKYWIGSGADRLEWPFCLQVMDAAVQHGEGTAAQLLKQSGGNPLRFQGLRQLFYAQIKQDSWQRNGKAWMARMGRLLVEASR